MFRPAASPWYLVVPIPLRGCLFLLLCLNRTRFVFFAPPRSSLLLSSLQSLEGGWTCLVTPFFLFQLSRSIIPAALFTPHSPPIVPPEHSIVSTPLNTAENLFFVRHCIPCSKLSISHSFSPDVYTTWLLIISFRFTTTLPTTTLAVTGSQLRRLFYKNKLPC